MYVDAGPITYQLQVSRQLNQYATEDRQYLVGLPAGTSSLTPDQLWYGVFLWAKNQTERRPHTTADNFTIVDTQGDHYHPIPLNPSLNPYAWTPQSLAPGAIEPAPDTTASFGPTQGGLLLFKLNRRRCTQPAADARDLAAERQGLGDDLARPLTRAAGVVRRVAPVSRHLEPRDQHLRTAGAAVAPPAPWFGNSAPTTIRGWPTGA